MSAAIPLAAQIIAQAAVGATGIGGIGAGLIIGGATILGGYVAHELFGSRDNLNQARDQVDIRGNYVSTDRTVPLVYGRRLVGSNDVFIEIGRKGEDPEGTDNYLWVVHVLGEGLCEGINQVEKMIFF